MHIPASLSENISALLTETQQICDKIARFSTDPVNIKQLERDLPTIRGNLYLAEIKISQAENILQSLRQKKQIPQIR